MMRRRARNAVRLLAHLTPAPAFSLNPLSLPADTTPTAQPRNLLPATVAHGPPLGSRAPPPLA